MKLQTLIPLVKASMPIDYNSDVLLLGSCFAENIGEKFKYFKFCSLVNPFGILFHPLALEEVLVRSVEQKPYTETDIFSVNGSWQCFDAHSSLGGVSKEKVLDNLNQGSALIRTHLKTASHIVITLGTAWAYRYKETQRLVANCHKMPQAAFQKELLSVEALTLSLERLVKLVTGVNPGVSLVFTISPVRHLKDGFVENQVGKSHLITALHQLLETHPDTAYFPAYELMMDELRDYRFYADDMVHPNALAIEYIWEKFREMWISGDVAPLMDKVEEVQKGLLHRPFQPASEGHQVFLRSLERKISYLKEKCPHMQF
ncbi:MAG: GSCFA domain-containing protein [Sediminicola sp.]|tara:strand:- start:24079 stop:25026 length:948 start_codon:yes stop_codon:yes gene_type:complete